MHREPPRVTVTAPGSGGPPPDELGQAPARRSWPTAVGGLLALAVAGTVAVRDGAPPPAPVPPLPAPAAAPLITPTSGITATASLAGAPTDEPYAQRLALTVELPPFDGRGDSGGRLLGDEVLLVQIGVRGFTVEADDPRSAVPLGRFGRSTSGRSTTVPATAVVDDCALEPQARRDVVLTVRTGSGPAGTVRARCDGEVVRAFDRLFSRTCRRAEAPPGDRARPR